MSVSPLGQPLTVASVGPLESSRSLARAENGNFVVVWDSHDPNTAGVYAAVYNPDGSLRVQVQIDNDPGDYQATVAMDGFGDFAVAWAYDDKEILVQQLDDNGNFVGHFDVVASAYTDFNPSVALNDNQQLVVAYDQIVPGQDGTTVNLWCQQGADNPGHVFGGATTGGDPQPSVALNENNQGVLAYAQADATGDEMMTFFSFTPQQGILGGRGLTHTAGPEGDYQDSNPAVAINNNGTMLIAYTNTFFVGGGPNGTVADSQVEVVRYAWDYTELGDQRVLAVQSNPKFTEFPEFSWQYRPSAALDSAGDFVVTATQDLYQTNRLLLTTNLVSTSVVGQLFAADGSAISAMFGVGSVADNPAVHKQDLSSVAMDGAGNFVVAYQDTQPASNTLMAVRFAFSHASHGPGGNNGFVGGQDQTITFDAPPDATYGDAPITLDGTASSGLPVSYQVLSGPATVQGDVLTITGAGTVMVEASQVGDGVNFSAAAPVDQSFTVNPAQLTVTADDQTRLVGQADPVFTATITGFVNGDTLDTSGVTGAAAFASDDTADSPAGTYTITPTQGTLTAANYTFTFVVGTLTVNPAPLATQTITFGALSDATYGDAPITLNATADSGLPVSYQVLSGPATLQDNVLTITGVGVVTVEASQPGDGVNFGPAAPVDQSFTGNQAMTTVALRASARSAAAGQVVTFMATVASQNPGAGVPDGMVTFMDGSNVLGTADLTNGVASFQNANLGAGSHHITAVYDGSDNFMGSDSAAVTETIKRAATRVSLTSSARTAALGHKIELTARISVAGTAVVSPGGTVVFKDGRTVLGKATVINGVAILDVTTLKHGKHSITAVYSGDADFLGSNSAVLTETIR
jgi:hypothetical protein